MLIKNQCEANVTGDFEQQMKIPERFQDVAMPKTEARDATSPHHMMRKIIIFKSVDNS